MDRGLAVRLRRRILAALACGTACTDRDLDGPADGASAGAEDGGTSTGGSNDASAEDSAGVTMTTTTATTTATTMSTSVATTADDDDDDDDDGGILFDMGVPPDSQATDPIPDLDCEAPTIVGRSCTTEFHDEYAHVYACIEIGVDGQCPAVDEEPPYAALHECLDPSCNSIEALCGPDPARADACCYWTVAPECIAPGRPFVVKGRDRVADVCARGDWRDAIALDIDAASSPIRAALAQAWTEDARCEHAAVASFARFTLQLLALGAPSDLVARAQRAALDELRHARAFFGLASAYAVAPVGPGPLDTSDALADGCDLEAVVVATVREGCIAETISLVQLATAQANASDPALRSVLATIVDEELAHVELAWSFVAWALAQGDVRLHAAVARAFAAAETAIPRAPSTIEPAPHEHAAWSAAGRLRADERAALARATLRDLVRPCARRLLGRADRPRDVRI